MLELDPRLDLDTLRTAWQQDQRLQINGVWKPEGAERVARALADETAFATACWIDERYTCFTREELSRQLPVERLRVREQIMRHAANGAGFVYGRHEIPSTRPDLPTPAALLRAFEALNSPELLDFIRRLTGAEDVCCASAQATRYAPGDFLTRHNDVVGAEGRRVAYVAGFTPRWHPDWGGLLQFYRPDGTPRDAWTPGFNTLVLFDVRHVHAVTFVAPFAPVPRLSITGWFRAVPLSR